MKKIKGLLMAAGVATLILAGCAPKENVNTNTATKDTHVTESTVAPTLPPAKSTTVKEMLKTKSDVAYANIMSIMKANDANLPDGAFITIDYDDESYSIITRATVRSVVTNENGLTTIIKDSCTLNINVDDLLDGVSKPVTAVNTSKMTVNAFNNETFKDALDVIIAKEQIKPEDVLYYVAKNKYNGATIDYTFLIETKLETITIKFQGPEDVWPEEIAGKLTDGSIEYKIESELPLGKALLTAPNAN